MDVTTSGIEIEVHRSVFRVKLVIVVGVQHASPYEGKDHYHESEDGTTPHAHPKTVRNGFLRHWNLWVLDVLENLCLLLWLI
jgi:hypothetical protein